jgi:hypothetical protein
MKYRQCQLIKKSIKYGHVLTCSWIPEKFAKRGKIVKLKDDDGWEVTIVGSISLDEEDAKDRSQDYKKTRKASDI